MTKPESFVYFAQEARSGEVSDDIAFWMQETITAQIIATIMGAALTAPAWIWVFGLYLGWWRY